MGEKSFHLACSPGRKTAKLQEVISFVEFKASSRRPWRRGFEHSAPPPPSLHLSPAEFVAMFIAWVNLRAFALIRTELVRFTLSPQGKLKEITERQNTPVGGVGSGSSSKLSNSKMISDILGAKIMKEQSRLLGYFSGKPGDFMTPLLEVKFLEHSGPFLLSFPFITTEIETKDELPYRPQRKRTARRHRKQNGEVGEYPTDIAHLPFFPISSSPNIHYALPVSCQTSASGARLPICRL
ncbi:hypothetical protein EYF80_017342 [Liparis tanakae]|uniref:Uncharacterized protein n=1 Tax=Liparis tanakae TaxID=230148 RepID=A0A4Z2I2W2_9TELE|nr:hypothetical protein EYF80_017342 [Liparis tanakae]